MERKSRALNLKNLILEIESNRLSFQVASVSPRQVSPCQMLLPFGIQMEIESLRLDFHLDAKWQERHIRSHPNIKTESLRLDLQPQNRVS